MKLTPGQVQSLLGLSRATYRHWKDALPPLEGRNGHSQCFSLGDLFAMALIKAMTDDAGLRVGALHAISATLFAQCGNQSWAGLERSSLVVELPRVRVEFISESQAPQFSGIGIVGAVRPDSGGVERAAPYEPRGAGPRKFTPRTYHCCQ